jgi:hypothetical protein
MESIQVTGGVTKLTKIVKVPVTEIGAPISHDATRPMLLWHLHQLLLYGHPPHQHLNLLRSHLFLILHQLHPQMETLLPQPGTGTVLEVHVDVVTLLAAIPREKLIVMGKCNLQSSQAYQH